MKGLTKFKKNLEKKEFNVGLSVIPDWISTGNSALNNIISGDMLKGIPVGRSSIISGLQGTGKSFLVSNIAKNAQEKGYFVVYLDTEYSVGEGFMEKIGVDLDEERFMAVNVATIEDAISFFSELFKNFDKEEKIGIIVDSLSNLVLEGDSKKFEDGKVAYGQGLQQKLFKQAVTMCNSKLGNRNMFAVFTSHLYINGSDAYGNPILKPNVGEGTLYIPSVGVELTKAPLKDGKEHVGISVRCKTFKTRYTKAAKRCEFALPWNRGMDFLDGSLDVLEEAGIVETNGGWKKYIDRETGEEVKFQKSGYEDHAEKLMKYYSEDAGETQEKDESDASIEMIEEKD